MTPRDTYTVEIAGLIRHLPLFEVAPGVRIAVFNMLGDTYVVKAASAALAEKLRDTPAEVLVTAEAKGIPLIYEMSALMGLPYVVLRKTYKSYMGDVISADTVSITTGQPQTLFLDEKDKAFINGRRAILVDDVVSTGSTLKAMEALVEAAGGSVSSVAAVFTEGDADWSQVVALDNLPIYKIRRSRTMPADAVTLTIFNHLFASVAEEMGVTLGRTAYSPNIKERLDYSCALFLGGEGEARMLAQAAHIPVHLGAMPASVRAAVARCAPFSPGDVVILNDPYLGGNHLPDITLVSPVFTTPAETVPSFYVASRAHHADVGGMSPGSMPLSTELYQEGLIIPPVKLVAGGERNEALWSLILRNVRTPWERDGDLAAQLAAHAVGERRLQEIVATYTLSETLAQANDLLSYAETLTRAAISDIPDGRYAFRDALDNDGQTEDRLPICVTVTIAGDSLTADFTGTTAAVAGNLNAVPAIVQSAVVYCLRCVAAAQLETDLPMNDGLFAPLTVVIPAGSLLDPYPPHAVAAGNVETSQRVVDVVFGALALALPELIPAASQGTMNNVTFGGTYPDEWAAPSRQFAYYETIGGGAGAGPEASGASGVHVHMSNTRNTPVEALEYSYPLQIESYRLRRGSGGAGLHQGGDGLERAIRFLTPVTVTLTSERREIRPYGLQGGEPAACGHNWIIRGDQVIELPGKATFTLQAGDTLVIETPGGGGWGAPTG